MPTVKEPLTIADQGFFWVGVERKKMPYGTIPAGQMYVQYQIPVEQKHRWPLVMVHGGGGQGTDYLGTPDGREGWATWFLRQGYAVYVVDRPGHGRAPYHADALGPASPPATYEGLGDLFTRPEEKMPGAYPQAKLHSQWPKGDAKRTEENLDQMLAGMGPMPTDLPAYQENMARVGGELLDRIGPSVLMTHSMGGPSGWMMVDARPKQVKAVIAIEPFGPAFAKNQFGSLDWGLTSAPVAYDPPAASPEELTRVLKKAPRPDLQDCYIQAEPARKLKNFLGIPILVMVAEASFLTPGTHGVVDFLRQAGCDAELMRLEEHGVHGNGHAMMFEENSEAVAALLEKWIAKHAS
ncbi:MAG: alpha/beta hydrolase [Stellaceae bacterium]